MKAVNDVVLYLLRQGLLTTGQQDLLVALGFLKPEDVITKDLPRDLVEIGPVVPSDLRCPACGSDNLGPDFLEDGGTRTRCEDCCWHE
jgi:hypothetical protein